MEEENKGASKEESVEPSWNTDHSAKSAHLNNAATNAIIESPRWIQLMRMAQVAHSVWKTTQMDIVVAMTNIERQEEGNEGREKEKQRDRRIQRFI